MIKKTKRWYSSGLHRWNVQHNPTEVEFWIARAIALIDWPRIPRYILDVGGGTGRMKKHLVWGQAEYVILDPSRNQPCDIAVHHGDVEDPGAFANNEFDLIGCFEVLEHLAHPGIAMKNISRWLIPGGHLILSTPQYWHKHGWPDDYYRYTDSGLRLLAKEAAFIEVALWPMGGPCLMIWSAIELNFRHPLRWPIVCQVVTWPAILIARLIDWLIFRNQQQWKHMDTRGWIGIWRKNYA